MDYRDLIKRNNRGVLFEERDNSVYSITRFNNRISLVIGCSNKGVINSPVVVVSPENFIQIFGDIDYSLERKGSFFHRTALNMLRHGPVICVNLRLVDDEKDKYNWISMSASSAHANAATRTNPLSDFYDVSGGFWKRSLDKIELLNRQNSADAQRLLNFVNMGDKPMSLLVFKADVRGFDVPFEDWYDSQSIPPYVHPKELVSDYLVQVIAVEGRWTNYPELSVHPKWGEYFDRYGILKDKVDLFLRNKEVSLIKKWTVSLIPYFKDKNNKDLYFATTINDDLNETGLFVSYDTDRLETDYRNGALDLTGDGLLRNNLGKVDFLSYKRNISDLFVLEERYMDAPGNSFGDVQAELADRHVNYAEGYIHNVRFTDNLFDVVGSFADDSVVSPLLVDIDSYAVLNGKKIDLSKPVAHGLGVYGRLTPGSKFGYLLYLNPQGVQAHYTSAVGLNQTPTLPHLNNSQEIALGYYIIRLDFNGVLHAEFTPYALDTTGFVSPFKRRIVASESPVESDYVAQSLDAIAAATYAPGISAYVLELTSPVPLTDTDTLADALRTKTNKNVTVKTQVLPGTTVRMEVYDAKEGVRSQFTKSSPTERQLVFEGAFEPSIYNYDQGRNFHLWSWLSNTLKEKQSLITTATGTKTRINRVEAGEDRYNRSLTLGFAAPVSVDDEWGIYIDDIEFLLQGQQNGVLDPEHIGKDSGLFQSYLNGDVNSGDPFFYSLGDEEDVEFKVVGQENLLVINEPSFQLYEGKIIVQGSKYNDSLFTVLDSYVDGVLVYVRVAEAVVAERVERISFFDADEVKTLDIAYQEGKISASIKPLDADPVEFYNRSFGENMQAQDWKRTLDVVKVYNQNLIGVDLDRYVGFVKIGYSLLATPQPRTDSHREVLRNTTRIVDVYASRDEPGILCIETDSAVDVTGNQTECMVPLHQWITSLDFKVLEPFVLRRDVMPDGSEERQQQILGLVNTNTKLAAALTSERMEWRYLVDSFGKGLYSSSKQELAQLCEKKQGAVVFANFPSIRQLRESTSPRFTTQGVLDTQLLLQGGDRMSSGGDRFTLTTTGQSYIVYCAPYVKIRERGRIFHIPPAAYVAGMYMLKFNVPTLFDPWSIMSGVENGRVADIDGLEEIFNEDDLADLDTLGVTVISTYKNIQYHLYNQTTAAPLGSALRDVHIREALIELERELRLTLQPFQWKPLTSNYQRLMQDAVDAVCTRYRKAGALYAFQNEVILPASELVEQIVVVNTGVEVVRGVKLIISRITINSTNSTN